MLSEIIASLAPSIITIGWLVVVWMILLVAWKTYMLMKMIDYISAIEWTFMQITLPEDTEETPKSMEVVFEVMGGMHKNPDLNELYFDGYLEPWVSFEVCFTQNNARYIMVVPTAHRRLFESVVYAQYPKANIEEVEDYSLRYDWHDLRKKYELYGTEMALNDDDILPIKTYREFEATLAEKIPFVDPQQITVETLTNVEPGEEFWIQILVRPVDGKSIKKWEEKGEERIAVISGQAKKEKPGMWENFREVAFALPGELFSALFRSPIETEKEKDEKVLRFFNPVDEAKMKGILQKISSNGYMTKIRAVHIAPVGQMKKPNIGRLIGVFKQYATFHLNHLYPDGTTKTNGPNFIMRNKRRLWREKTILQNFQWRDFFGRDSGYMLNAEELATLYHFPVKYVAAPSVERAKAGKQTPPANLPYA